MLFAESPIPPHAAMKAAGDGTLAQAVKGTEKQAEEGTLTGDAAAIQLQPQGDAIVPALRTDAHKACEHRAVDLVENHLCGILVGLKCLQGTEGTNTVMSSPSRKK